MAHKKRNPVPPRMPPVAFPPTSIMSRTEELTPDQDRERNQFRGVQCLFTIVLPVFAVAFSYLGANLLAWTPLPDAVQLAALTLAGVALKVLNPTKSRNTG